MLSYRGFVVEKSKLTQEKVAQLKLDLCVKPEIHGSPNFTQADFFCVYKESPHKFRIPRFYGIENFERFVSKFSETSINVSFNGTLKDSLKQNDAVNACVQSLKSCGGGLLSLPTGYGKTTCSLAVLARLGVKTLIIVHKEFLMNQWKERIQQFLPNATIGIIRQSKTEMNCDIVIAMLQTLCTRQFEKNAFTSFGLTIIDETHHICSRVFSQSMFCVTTRFILGLSATPERKDKLTHVLHWFIGPTCFSIQRENTSDVYVKQIVFDHKTFYTEPPLNASNKVNLPEMINIIVEIEERNKLIVSLLKECLLQNRNIIVLTERRSHCENLLKLLQAESHESMGLYMGGMKQSVLKENEEKCRVLFATYSLAHEGLDIPKLDTLILATSKSDVVQSCGRILRESGTKKNSPVIYDIVDNWGPLVGQSKKRKTFYNKSKFIVNSNASSLDESKTVLNGYSFVEFT